MGRFGQVGSSGARLGGVRWNGVESERTPAGRVGEGSTNNESCPEMLVLPPGNPVLKIGHFPVANSKLVNNVYTTFNGSSSLCS